MPLDLSKILVLKPVPATLDDISRRDVTLEYRFNSMRIKATADGYEVFGPNYLLVKKTCSPFSNLQSAFLAVGGS